MKSIVIIEPDIHQMPQKVIRVSIHIKSADEVFTYFTIQIIEIHGFAKLLFSNFFFKVFLGYFKEFSYLFIFEQKLQNSFLVALQPLYFGCYLPKYFLLFFFCKVAFGIKTDHNFSLFVTPKGKEGLILGLVFGNKIHIQ